MSKPVWLVFNGYGDTAICSTKKQAESEAQDLDAYRHFYFADHAKKYICLIMKCMSKKVAEDRIQSMAAMRAKRSDYSYF